ncbi:MAG: hypothetical protein KAT38_10190 [Bacteroidales bacterium]|nr:hypothetical protein [Bacteroidales bacterium]
MKTRNVWILIGLIAGIMICGCSPRSKYERRLKQELASGVRYDSLFMGLYLGMSKQDFYTHCWILNREGLIKQSSNNTMVEYEVKDELEYPATMNYYPEFVQGKIFEMPVRFIYNGWTPWNKKLSSDNLELEVLKLYEKIYGEGFIKVKHPKRGMAYIRIDGNRRITIFKEDDLHVWTVFTDMSVKRDLNDSTSKAGIIHDEITKDFEK